jgi:predicted anti-sigma-YlaC factor YlaD
MVTARIGTPSGSGELLEKVDVGHSAEVCVGNQSYIVRLLGAETFKTTFAVSTNANATTNRISDRAELNIRKKEFALPDIKTITIERGRSGTADGITISVIGISYEGEPLRHMVIARIGTSSGSGELLEKVDVGHLAEVCVGNQPYIVRLLGAETFKATFAVSIKPRH